MCVCVFICRAAYANSGRRRLAGPYINRTDVNPFENARVSEVFNFELGRFVLNAYERVNDFEDGRKTHGIRVGYDIAFNGLSLIQGRF